MTFVKNFKLFAFWALCLVVSIQARSLFGTVSIFQIGDVRIEMEDGKWTCDLIVCPNATYECYVSKTNEKNASVMVRTDICYSQDDKPLLVEVTTSPGNATEKITVEIHSFRNGTININSTDTVFDSQKFKKQLKKELKKELQGIDSNVSNEMKHLKESLDSMENGLQHMFK